MKNRRENFLLWNSIDCIRSIIFSGVNIAMGGVVGISGIICFIIGMSIPSQMGMSPEAVSDWKPSMERLPDAGRFMYRVDVTMDEPIKSTILCGPCGNLETIDGPRPSEYICPACSKLLWSNEEE